MVMVAVFDVADFLHPQDLSARQQLERIPLLQPTMKKYLSAVTDRTFRQILLSSALRLGPRQLPDIYGMLPPICEAFGIVEPELYITRGQPNARAVGHSRTAILIYNQLLEDLAEDEINAVLAHECGHIVAEHILYRQMAHEMVMGGASAEGFGSPTFKVDAESPTSQIQTALFNWYRKSELTADRAAVAYLGTAEPMQRALFHIIGLPKWVPVDISHVAFFEQAAELDQITESSRWDRFLARDLQSGLTHPITATRMRELESWAQSDRFRQLLGIAGVDHPEKRLTCARCGRQPANGQRFCQNCGTSLLPSAADEAGKE